jgi:translation initiation factor IF-2
MQQRRPRLGDVLDDYCPRERRVTNHVVVAMIEDAVKQTRCATCDSDHEYKQAKVPSPRRPKTVAAIQEGAEGFEAKPVLAPPKSASDASAPADLEEPAEAPIAPVFQNSPGEPVPLQAGSELPAGESIEEPGNHEDEGPVHRRLIRAQLPRPEGHVPERKEPEFTIRQQGARGGGGGREVDGNSVGYRPKGGGQRPGGFGHGGGGGHSRFGGQRHGSGQQQRPAGGRGPNNQQRGGRPDGAGGAGASNSRGPGQRGPGSGRRRGGR